MTDLPSNRSTPPPHLPVPATDRRGRLLPGFWPLLIAALIFVASSRSQVVAPNVTRIDDKIVHFAVYGLLATLVCRIGGGWRGAVWSLVIVSAYGASDEWHQSFVPGRNCEFADWVADTLGAALAIGLYAGWPWYRRWLETPLGRRRSGGSPAAW